jgi:hypothetical protein
MTVDPCASLMICPAYLDEDGKEPCLLPAEVEYRYVVQSTGGPMEAAKIRCLSGHWFNGPMAFLTLHQRPRTEEADGPPQRPTAPSREKPSRVRV